MKQNYNNESLARLGHGKWKSALGHTLLIIGMVLMSLGAFAQTPTNGLYMHKTWIPDETDPTGSKGEIMLETFVTGESIITEAHVPTDIVVVVDQSGSMDETMSDGTKRIDALKAALNTFVANVQQDAFDNTCDHRIAIVGFASAPVGSFNTYTNTELLTPSEISYDEIKVQDYKDALVYANVNGSINSVLTTAIRNIAAEGGTVMDYGLRMAKNILSNREIIDFDPDNNPETHNSQPRTQVVVFFTDGYPGIYTAYKDRTIVGNTYKGVNSMFAQCRYPEETSRPNVVSQTVADNAVNEARELKINGAIVYSVGIFDGASPSSDYQTQLKYYSQSGPITQDGNNYQYRYYYLPGQVEAAYRERSWSWGGWNWGNWNTTDEDIYYWEPATEPTSGNSGDAAANGLMHFISSNYAANEIETSSGTPWATMTLQAHPAGDHNNNKYFSASNASELANIFESIASESGGESYSLDPSTVIHDEISSSFQLNIPDNYQGDLGNLIRAYAPKFKQKNGNEMVFEPITDGANNARLTMGTDEHGNEHVVTGGTENRLPDGIVQYDDDSQVLTFTNFNFSAMWCGYQEEGTTQTAHGRKLVMFIPIELADGSWGDGIETNGPVSLIYPDGSTSDPLLFNVPTANVLGSVWTEVVTTKPSTFKVKDEDGQVVTTISDDGEGLTAEIGTPEDLAWFISEVNGRIGYNVQEGEANTNNVASHPKLNGKLTADIDMSAHNWVPIGCGWQVEVDPQTGLTKYKEVNEEKVHMSYEGTFDGNGHVITGLKNNASKFYKLIGGSNRGVVVFPGMFSDVKGTVKNVFVLDADFRGKHHDEHFVHHGIIADTLEAGGMIFNCEAAGRITCNNDDVDNDIQLIYGGLVGLNLGTVHSSMAMAELTAYTMGGMIGENRGTFFNGFTNGVYNCLTKQNDMKPVGGIAAINTGTINNCYVRFERDNQNLDLQRVIFGQITGTGNYTNSYTPQDFAGKIPAGSEAGTDTYTNTLPAQWLNRNGQNNLLTSGESLLKTLENGKKYTVGNETITGASWKRTTALGYQYSLHGGNINKDYPVLKFNEFTCLGSADGIRVDYAATMKEILHRHNTGNMNENTGLGNSYKVAAHPAINAGTINLYANDELKASSKAEDATYFSNNENVVVYIDENTSLLQGGNSTIVGFTGQTLKNFASEGGERWHNISSSLSNSMFGWTYTNTPAIGQPHTAGDDVQHAHSWETNPCGMRFNQSDDDTEIFPADFINYHHGDFYCFYEPQYHWINFRRHTNCHWHMDDYEKQIIYKNEDHFIPGKGYLMAINADQTNVNRPEQFIQNLGTLNNGDVTIPVTYTAANEWTGLAGYNLLGNPYQSFLDFDAFVEENTALWNGETYAQTYAVYDPSADAYVQYKSTSSNGSKSADQYLNMHQGFFIRISQTGKSAKFTNAMRSNEGTPNFRGSERPNYPLINFELSDGSNGKEIAVLEIGRPENDGAEKLRMASAKGHISLRHDNQDFAILFRDMTKGSQPLYFDAEEDGTFTLSWNTANANFQSLTLVDNIAGVKYDMLAHDSYTFEGNTDNYKSRFKVVIGEFTDVEENEDSIESNFAFFDGSEWVVNGQGQLDVVDMLGRTMLSERLTSDQSRVSLDGMAQGVYLMRVTNGNEVKVQKIVVR